MRVIYRMGQAASSDIKGLLVKLLMYIFVSRSKRFKVKVKTLDFFTYWCKLRMLAARVWSSGICDSLLFKNPKMQNLLIHFRN